MTQTPTRLNIIDDTTALVHDGELQVATANTRNAATWRNQVMTLSEFVRKLSHTQRSQESQQAYMAMPKAEQDELKDVGGFVGGLLKGGRRSKHAVANRSIMTLDADYADINTLDRIRRVLGNYAYTIYSTRKHTEDKPRYRLVVYPDRAMLSDEYEAAMRKVADMIGVEQFDDTTYDVNRLMYWPSTCADGTFFFEHNDASMLSIDNVLAKYDDWRDALEWPQSQRETKKLTRHLEKQADPLTKKGIVGAFCRVFSIYQAVDITSSYEHEEGQRYTYKDGSTTKGLVIYDGKLAYSNHDSDPVGKQCVNAFDMVRLHRFGEMDDDAKPNTPTNKLPSYRAMTEWAREQEGVKTELVKSGIELDADEFDDFDTEPAKNDEDRPEWMGNLQVMEDGSIKTTFYNATVILSNDERIKDLMAFNELAMRITNTRTGDMWSDKDSLLLRKYVGKRYKADFPEAKIEDAIGERAHQKAYHPVRDYLESLEWDGTPRAETLFIDYFKCEDNTYAREVALCWLVAAVTRAFKPGFKFDHVPAIGGEQGIGKSSFIGIMAGDWYGELTSFDSKVAVEEMQGRWLMEINEMGATNRHDLEQQKAFLSAQETTVRMAYARHATQFKRQCVFIASTNQTEYLKDSTGNRRWWPIDSPVPYGEEIDLDGLRRNVDQIWAEAKALYDIGTDTELSEEAQTIAKNAQEEKREADSWEGIIREWLLQDADIYRYDPHEMDEKFEERTRVCVAEIWQDCLSMQGTPKRSESNRIAATLDAHPHWERCSTLKFGKRFGRQRGWMHESTPF